MRSTNSSWPARRYPRGHRLPCHLHRRSAVQSHSGETPDRPCLRVSRGRGALRVWGRRCLPCSGDSGSRPAAGCASEHLGEPAFRERVAGLHAEPVGGHRRVIAGVGLKRLIVTLPAGGDGRLPGRGPRRLACRAALAPSGAIAVTGGGRDRMHRGTIGRTFAAVHRRRPACCRLGGADEPDQEFVLWGTNRTYAGCFMVVSAQGLVLVVP